jgi:hypothetical protein
LTAVVLAAVFAEYLCMDSTHFATQRFLNLRTDDLY